VWSGRRQLAFCFPGLLASDATTAAPARTRRSPAADCHPLCTTGSSPSLAPTNRLQASNRIAPKSSEARLAKENPRPPSAPSVFIPRLACLFSFFLSFGVSGPGSPAHRTTTSVPHTHRRAHTSCSGTRGPQCSGVWWVGGSGVVFFCEHTNTLAECTPALAGEGRKNQSLLVPNVLKRAVGAEKRRRSTLVTRGS